MHVLTSDQKSSLIQAVPMNYLRLYCIDVHPSVRLSVRVLGNDGPLKITMYHMIPTGNKTVATTMNN